MLLIDYYLITKYPELLRIRVVRDNMARYNQALAYMSSVPETERLYIKLMRSRIDSAVLNRNNFVMLSAAAYAAAKYENPSMKNYRGGQESATGGHVDKIVTTYLTLRTTLSISAMIRSPFAYLSRDEIRAIEHETTVVNRGLPSTTGISADLGPVMELPPLRPDDPNRQVAAPAGQQ
jgi:hypothetical protein